MFGAQFDGTTFHLSTRSADVCSLHVESNIRYRYAHTAVVSEVCNTAETAQEVSFSITLPETAFISSFSIEIDGKVYNAYVKGKAEAQQIYTEAVQQGRTAGHVAVSARDSNRFNVSVNVEKKKKVIFRLTYEELLARKIGLYKHIINLDPGQIVQDFRVTVKIEESTDITELKVATLRKNNDTQSDPPMEMDNSLINIERPNPHTAVVKFAPTPEQQEALSVGGIRGQFVVQYDVDRSALHSQILVNDGYFTHYFAPEQLKPLPKHVTFVLDVSGSMQGRKIDQLKEAMEKIFADLLPQDYFSLLIFSSDVQIWRLEDDGRWDTATDQESDCKSLVVPASKENILRGKLAIYKLRAGGSTNIHKAMMVATHVTQLRKKLTSSPSPEPIIIFLTDGQPTTGICNRDEIITETTRLNQIGKATIFCLGLGNDVDFEFLKKLALRNSGFCRRIYEASDTALQLTDFYKEVSSPLLSNITFIYQPEQVESVTLTRHNFVTFFRGSELIVSGRIDPSLTEMEFRFGVSGNSSEGIRNFKPEETRVVFLKKAGFMERLWAYLTIQQQLDEEKKHEGETARDKKSQAMQLALKYSFVTPVTSLVVVRPDDQHYRATIDSEMNQMQPGAALSATGSFEWGHPKHTTPQFYLRKVAPYVQPTSQGVLFGSGQSVASQGVFSSGQFGTSQGLFGSIQPTSNSAGFGFGQFGTSQGLFGSVQPTANSTAFGSGQLINSAAFSTGQFGTSQGLFGSGKSPTNQTAFNFAQPASQGLFGSGQPTTNPTGFGSVQPTTNHIAFGFGQPGNQGNHGLTSKQDAVTGQKYAVSSVPIDVKHFSDILTEMVLVEGRSLSVLNENWFRKILDATVSTPNISVIVSQIHQNIAEKCSQIEQTISREVTNALVCLELEVGTKQGQTILAIHAQYIYEGNKILRTLTMKNLNPDWNKNHIIEFVTNTLERFGIKTVFYVTINIIRSISEVSDVFSCNDDENSDSADDTIFRTISDACAMLGITVFWNPTYVMKLAICQTMKTHQEITGKFKKFKSSQSKDQPLDLSLNTTEQKEIGTIEQVFQTLNTVLGRFHHSKLLFGDVYTMWMKSQGMISKLGTAFAENLSVNMKKSADKILKNPVFLSMLFLDPRYNELLNNDEKSLATEELKRLSNLKETGVTSNDVEILEKLKIFETTPKMPEDADVVQFWATQNEQQSDLKKLATILMSVPILQDTKQRFSSNIDIMLSTEPTNVKQDIVKVRCFQSDAVTSQPRL